MRERKSGDSSTEILHRTCRWGTYVYSNERFRDLNKITCAAIKFKKIREMFNISGRLKTEEKIQFCESHAQRKNSKNTSAPPVELDT